MLPWKPRKCQILPVNQNLSLIYFLLAKFQLVSCNPSIAISWQMTYTQKLPKLCSATLIQSNIEVFSCILPLCIRYDWITIMEYNKNELSGTINMLYYLKKFGHFTPLPLHNGHFLVSPRRPLWRGSTVFCSL